MNEFTEIYDSCTYIMDIDSFFMRISECGISMRARFGLIFGSRKDRSKIDNHQVPEDTQTEETK